VFSHAFSAKIRLAISTLFPVEFVAFQAGLSLLGRLLLTPALALLVATAATRIIAATAFLFI
jgi:hypothetical protein